MAAGIRIAVSPAIDGTVVGRRRQPMNRQDTTSVRHGQGIANGRLGLNSPERAVGLKEWDTIFSADKPHELHRFSQDPL